MNAFVRLTAGILTLLMLITGCSEKPVESQSKEHKELLIYCGITMIKPMMEIAKIIEKKHGCTINLIQGGSKDLYEALRFSKKGDMYLPGSEGYRTGNLAEGLLGEHVFVGYNKAAIMVQKGNPKKITKDLDQFTDKKFAVVLCNPDSGSIGRETKKVLERKGIAKEAFENSIYLTTDSRNLVNAIKKKEADLVINWYATGIWPENSEFIDAIEIDEQYAQRKRLEISLLTFAKHPDISRDFMQYAISPEGRAIFKKYGFLTDADLAEIAQRRE